MKRKFPPETQEEFDAWLVYQKQEGLVLDLLPNKMRINGKTIDIPEEVREQVAQSDDFVNEMRGILERFLMAEHMSDYLSGNGEFQLV